MEQVAFELEPEASSPSAHKLRAAAVRGMVAELLDGWHLVNTYLSCCRLAAAGAGLLGGIAPRVLQDHMVTGKLK